MIIQRLMLTALTAISAVSACKTDTPDTMVGTLERDRVEIKVESNEAIVAIHVRDGQQVAAEEPVLDQDNARMTARLNQMKAMRDQAAARLAELQRGPRPEAIRQAQATLQASQAITANTRSDLTRAQEIFDRGLSNQADLDRAKANWETASALEQAGREALASLLHGTTVEELQQAQSALNATEASLSQAEIDLQRLSLLAPVSGIVDKVLFKIGERPPVGSTVAVVLDDRRLFARVYVPEQLKAQVMVGKTLDVRVDGSADTIQGTVRWVSADASFTPYFALTEHDRSRLSFLAEVEVEDNGQLPVGLPLEAWLPGNEPR